MWFVRAGLNGPQIRIRSESEESLQGPHEKRLLHTLLDHYNVLERPVANESDPLQLSFGLTLMQIIDVDEKNQILTTNAWLNLAWSMAQVLEFIMKEIPIETMTKTSSRTFPSLSCFNVERCLDEGLLSYLAD
uniref:Neurotransmitter-gated ion-channel ligand-binding domain-containing protein n=1 Tax=Timema shepardi TaxID=629360 RepID=A0A7R9FWE7_TIMSH|nr:unnamed protein product [Timema shepardi]